MEPTEIPVWKQLIESRQPVRVLAILRRSSPLFEQSDLTIITDNVLDQLGADREDSRVLIRSTWSKLTLVVCDLYHTNYDFMTAHHPEDLPVVVVNFRSRGRFRIAMASKPECVETNAEVAKSHGDNGYNAELPFLDDHRNGNVPSYYYPRGLVYAPNPE